MFLLILSICCFPFGLPFLYSSSSGMGIRWVARWKYWTRYIFHRRDDSRTSKTRRRWVHSDCFAKFHHGWNHITFEWRFERMQSLSLDWRPVCTQKSSKERNSGKAFTIDFGKEYRTSCIFELLAAFENNVWTSWILRDCKYEWKDNIREATTLWHH